ncbi:multiple epidermal growth factor-like domains protein 10 [Crassostrea angulata]|uniref:multiple epidermal growth factor-like domains protein 10 n=1 Tax=Magallana angulata TaxID=2784310 RepID=UPI0022B13942|nr:multiple epidermal growth factor-like domains protein 10 [Crassostrea angulata]
MMIYGCVFTIFLVPVVSNDRGCHVNDWPHSCQANFIVGAQRCEPCESGRYGCNCSDFCPDNTYGSGCYQVCNCSDEEFCDHVNGCTKNSTTVSKNPTGRLPIEYSSVSPYKEGVYVTSSRQLLGGNPLTNLTMSLVVSSVIVIVFCTLFVCILIRVSKCYYKRKYSKLLNQLQSNEIRAEDTNIYSDYDYTDYRGTPSSNPLHTERNIYDQSNRVSYDILVLRNQSSTVNIYDSDCNSDIIPPCSKPVYESLPINRAKKDLDFELEPECLLNLFKEEEKDVSPCHLSNLDNVQSKFISETKL